MKMISKSFYYLKFNFLLQLKPNRLISISFDYIFRHVLQILENVFEKHTNE